MRKLLRGGNNITAGITQTFSEKPTKKTSHFFLWNEIIMQYWN